MLLLRTSLAFRCIDTNSDAVIVEVINQNTLRALLPERYCYSLRVEDLGY